jgi:hypothetical protein
MSVIPRFLHNLLIDGDGVVSLVQVPPCTPQEHFLISVPGTHFYYRLSKPQDLMLLEVLAKLMKFNYLVGSQTRDHLYPVNFPLLFNQK